MLAQRQGLAQAQSGNGWVRNFLNPIGSIPLAPIVFCGRDRRDLIRSLRMPFVLVVDDDESTGDAIRRLLGRMGYTAQWAPGGHEAIAALQVEKPDLVVLDWMMPGMNGLEVLR